MCPLLGELVELLPLFLAEPASCSRDNREFGEIGDRRNPLSPLRVFQHLAKHQKISGKRFVAYCGVMKVETIRLVGSLAPVDVVLNRFGFDAMNEVRHKELWQNYKFDFVSFDP